MSDLTRRDLIRSSLLLSGSTLVAGAVSRAHALLAGYPETTAEDLAAAGPRERLLFDFGWKFFQGHASDSLRDLGFGKDQGDFAKSGEFKFATEKFDDSKWRALDLPHDWAVELPFVRDEDLQSHGYKPLGRRYPETSVGWYRRVFDIPKEDAGRRVAIEFDGAFRSALVFLNGYFIGRNDNGYAPFRFDVTDFLSYGSKNYLVVRLDASFGDGWFYEGAGLYRHMWLTKTDALHLGSWESYVRPSVQGNAATLSLGTVVQNQNRETETCRVRWQVVDAAGKVLAAAEAPPQSVAPARAATFTASASLANPALWSPETPNLYSAVVTVESSGKPRDAEALRFGVRCVEVLDKEGRMIPTADNMIGFKVTGEGKLIGVGNGDPNCQESDKDPKRSLFNGLAQVIVQATRSPGTITVEAYTEDWPPPRLPATRVTITTKKVELRPAVT